MLNYPMLRMFLKFNGEFFLGYDARIGSHGRVTRVQLPYANALTLVPFPFNSTLNHVDSMASTLFGTAANVMKKPK